MLKAGKTQAQYLFPWLKHNQAHSVEQAEGTPLVLKDKDLGGLGLFWKPTNQLKAYINQEALP